MPIQLAVGLKGAGSLREYLDFCNEGYRARKKGVIYPVLAGRSGESGREAGGYYSGHVIILSGRPMPVIFCAEEIPTGDRWPLFNLEDAEFAFLESACLTGAAAFVLLGYLELKRVFLLPFGELQKRWRHWRWGSGPVTVKCGDRGLVETQFPDYLAPVAERPDLFSQQWSDVVLGAAS
ncbi:MAG: hypothetical protein ACPLQP_04515 [Moorellaceae bacterium]